MATEVSLLFCQPKQRVGMTSPEVLEYHETHRYWVREMEQGGWACHLLSCFMVGHSGQCFYPCLGHRDFPLAAPGHLDGGL